MHCWPSAQAGLLPQTQVPLAEQASARPSGQATHAAPSAPHWVKDEVTQLSPLQQPVTHDAAHELQTPWSVQNPPVAHGVHWAPPDPHSSSAVPGRHTFASQQPGQDEVVQRHSPLTQAWPAAHGPAQVFAVPASGVTGGSPLQARKKTDAATTHANPPLRTFMSGDPRKMRGIQC